MPARHKWFDVDAASKCSVEIVANSGVTLRQCVGCSGMVPDVQGPVHAYMLSSPGCWAWYGELTSLAAFRVDASPIARSCIADCFAVQHPGGAAADRRQRGSVAVHLTALCLLREFGLTPQRVSQVRQTMSARVLPRVGLDGWPYLAPPESVGRITVAEVFGAVGSVDFDDVAQQWTIEAWNAWGEHHAAVRGFAMAALSGEAARHGGGA